MLRHWLDQLLNWCHWRTARQGNVVSVCVCVLFAALEVNPQEYWMKQSAHLSLSNPNLVLSSCVPKGNVHTPVRKMRSYLTLLGAPDRGPGHANQCSTQTWQLGGKYIPLPSLKHTHMQLACTCALISSYAITHRILVLCSSCPETPIIKKNNSFSAVLHIHELSNIDWTQRIVELCSWMNYRCYLKLFSVLKCHH